MLLLKTDKSILLTNFMTNCEILWPFQTRAHKENGTNLFQFLHDDETIKYEIPLNGG